MEMLKRPRRLRGSEVLRKMVRETRMDKASLIYPMFVKEGSGIYRGDSLRCLVSFATVWTLRERSCSRLAGRRCKQCDVFRDSRSQG